jgi:hypothetical protein
MGFRTLIGLTYQIWINWHGPNCMGSNFPKYARHRPMLADLPARPRAIRAAGRPLGIGRCTLARSARPPSAGRARGSATQRSGRAGLSALGSVCGAHLRAKSCAQLWARPALGLGGIKCGRAECSANICLIANVDLATTRFDDLIRVDSNESVLGPRPHVKLLEPRASVKTLSVRSNTSPSAPRALRT